MSATVSEPPVAITSSVSAVLLPIMTVVFIGFLIIGMALPVLPLHVHQGLGLSTFVVGLVAGSQFVAALISRIWSGHYADSRGAKRAVIAGLLAAVGGGLLYLLSLHFIGTPGVSASVLLLGRALLGAARCRGKFHHHRWSQLGAGACRSCQRRKSHRLGRHGDVCRSRLWGAGWHHPLRLWGFSQHRRHDGPHPPCHAIAGAPARPHPATPEHPLSSSQGG